MNNDFSALTQYLLVTPVDTSEWQVACDRVVDKVLRARKIVKRHSKAPLAGVQLEIYTALKTLLCGVVYQTCLKTQKPRSLNLAQLQSQLDLITPQVLTYDRLTQLAIHLQQQPFRSVSWQHALDDLFSAVYLSGKLKRPVTYGSGDTYSDITNEALMQAIKDIQKFDATRSHFIGWINQVYISRRGIDIRHQQEDTLKKSHHRHIMPIKYALRQTFVRAKTTACKQHLLIYLKSSCHGIESDLSIILSLSLCLIKRQIEDEPITGSQLLFAMAEAVTGRSVEFDSLDVPIRNQDGTGQAKEIASPVPASPPKIDFLRACLQQQHTDACANILEKHIKSNPQATLRTIALQRIEGKTLKEISQAFNIVIPTIQKFYERNMLKATECLKHCVDDQMALWEMQHPPG
ncbi:MAG: hypothetical protein AB8B99_14155 [Phormidesmis sp.]